MVYREGSLPSFADGHFGLSWPKETSVHECGKRGERTEHARGGKLSGVSSYKDTDQGPILMNSFNLNYFLTQNTVHTVGLGLQHT